MYNPGVQIFKIMPITGFRSITLLAVKVKTAYVEKLEFYILTTAEIFPPSEVVPAF